MIQGTKVLSATARLLSNAFVIDENGTKLGEMATRDALATAQERGLDLIEVAPNARPPVCRFADYGKILYEKKKRNAKAKKNATTITVKEVKFTLQLVTTTSIQNSNMCKSS